MHVVEQSEFPVYEGSMRLSFQKKIGTSRRKTEKSMLTGVRKSMTLPTHISVGIHKMPPAAAKACTGILRKPTARTKKTRYYYYCKNTVTPTGHECTFRLNIEQTEMNRMVASIISAMVSDPRFADAIKAKIGSAVDTNDLEKQLEALQAQLRQTLGTKARLERQMDGLDVNDPYYDRKISDLQRRYDEQYGRIDEIEVQIDDVQSQIRNIRQEKISGDNIYRLLLAFDQVYEAASEVERKEFMRAFIERIELFPEKQLDGNWIRKIIFNFPVPVNGTEVKELPLENETMVDCCAVMADESNWRSRFRAHFGLSGPLARVLQGMLSVGGSEAIQNLGDFVAGKNDAGAVLDKRGAWRPNRWGIGWFDRADPCGETGFYGSVFAAKGRKRGGSTAFVPASAPRQLAVGRKNWGKEFDAYFERGIMRLKIMRNGERLTGRLEGCARKFSGIPGNQICCSGRICRSGGFYQYKIENQAAEENSMKLKRCERCSLDAGEIKATEWLLRFLSKKR